MHDQLPQDSAQNHQRPRRTAGRDAHPEDQRLTRRCLVALAAAAIALAIGPGGGAAAAERSGKFADPQPTIDAPRRIVISLAEDDPKRINAVLSNIVNIQKYYDAAQVKLAVIAYGPGIAAVLKDASPAAPRIESLQALEVEFIACGATLETLHKTPADLLPDVHVVPNGLPEIVERSLGGWIHLRP
ncbi:DsrE family protein [Ferrovibrio sp.]|uniref:DsrE family protein n=1 Tax=Ferrovibrio sp. TaxID=1917215 RepID=UPI0035124EDE